MRRDEERIKLKEGLREMNGENSLLVICPSKDLQLDINTVVEYMMKRKNLSCIYFCLNKPHVSIEQIFRKRDLNKRTFFFIDCTTALTTATLPRPERNLLYVSTPADLTGMGIAIKQIKPALLKNGFIVIDSLRTLLIYNRSEAISDFIRMLTSFATVQGTRIIVLTTTSHDPLFDKVMPFFNRVIEHY